jgi:MFS superfamily sulfate permease-like transporter
MWKTRRRDFIVCIGTFIATLLVGVDSGIILGVVLNLLMFMVSLAWVNIDEVGRDDNARVYEEQYVPLRNNADATTWRGVSIIKVEDSLCFINVDVVTQTIEKIGHDTANRDGLETAESLFPKSPEELAAVYGEENVRSPHMPNKIEFMTNMIDQDPLPTDGEESSIDRALRVRTTKELTKYIILDLSKVNYIDSSALYRLKNFHGELKSSEDVELFFACLQGSVYRALAKAGVVEKVGERHFFLSIEDALASIPEIRDRRMTIPKQATYSATEPRNIHDV